MPSRAKDPGYSRVLDLRAARTSASVSAATSDRPATPTDRPTVPPESPRSDAAAAPASLDEALARTQGELRDLERERIRQALEQCAGNQRKAAELLGIARRTLVNRLNELGLPRPRK